MLAPIAGRRRDGKSSFRTLTRYLTEGRDPVTDEIVERGEHLLSDNLLSRETLAAEMRALTFMLGYLSITRDWNFRIRT